MLKPYGRVEGFGLGAQGVGTPKGGLRQRVEEFQAASVSPEIAAMASEVLLPYNLAELCQSSQSVTSIFLWTQEMVDSISESTGGLPVLPAKPREGSGASDADRFAGKKRREFILRRQRELFGIVKSPGGPTNDQAPEPHK